MTGKKLDKEKLRQKEKKKKKAKRKKTHPRTIHAWSTLIAARVLDCRHKEVLHFLLEDRVRSYGAQERWCYSGSEAAASASAVAAAVVGG